jgi:CRP-like cAMP-binding protein
MVPEGSSPNHSTLLLSGLAARYNVLLEGDTQITALHVPGDFVDLQSFLMKPIDHSILAVTHCETAAVPHEALERILHDHPNLARLLWISTAVDAGMHRRWTFVVGSMRGPRHLAHLICELYLRLQQVGRAD